MPLDEEMGRLEARCRSASDLRAGERGRLSEDWRTVTGERWREICDWLGDCCSLTGELCGWSLSNPDPPPPSTERQSESLLSFAESWDCDVFLPEGVEYCCGGLPRRDCWAIAMSTKTYRLTKIVRPLYGFLSADVGLIRSWNNAILNIKLTVLFHRIWPQQRINSKITYRRKNLKISPELPRKFPKIPQSPEMSLCLQIVVQMYLSVSRQRERSWNFHRNNVYRHLEQVSRLCVCFHFQW